ncbi:AlbA family DNA-binding domain-containing protein [Runella sp.]|uniref:AlbA family DNA-binding domain-containing protein n=1 Tax=Runella sp. TaxID=1960881 RepID=UPI003D0E49D0
MRSFYEKESYTFEDIKIIIDNEVEESIYLEFKSAASLGKTDSCKNEISKDVSAFANSDGGIIIYGIKEFNHKAADINFVDGNEYSKEWLEHVINSSIQRRIPNVEIHPLRQNGSIEHTIYIVKIPSSFEAPHISRTNKFYKRFNFESLPMEEYEIRQLYGRTVRPKLSIHSWDTLLDHNRVEDIVRDKVARIRIEVKICNDGDALESMYKVNAYLKPFGKDLSVEWDHRKTNYDYTRMDENVAKISATGTSPIFPDEVLTVLRFILLVPVDKLVDILTTTKLELRLLYTKGESSAEYELKEVLNGIKEIFNKRLDERK